MPRTPPNGPDGEQDQTDTIEEYGGYAREVDTVAAPAPIGPRWFLSFACA